MADLVRVESGISTTVRVFRSRILRVTRVVALLALCATGESIGCGGPVQEDEYRVLPASSFAGMKAGITCSAVFLADRALADVKVDELGGLVAAADGAEAPVVDRASRSASVAFDEAEPPRVAGYGVSSPTGSRASSVTERRSGSTTGSPSSWLTGPSVESATGVST